jgi:Fic family protein
MRSFIDLDKTFANQPRELGVILARVDTGRGREQLFEDQAPGLLLQLAESARIASITASNAIEGVMVEGETAERIAEGSSRFRNRNEREFAGYRDATDSLMNGEESEPLTVPFTLHLHRLLFHHTKARGGHLKTDQNLIVSYQGGHREVIFTPSPPEETELLLTELLVRFEDAKEEGSTHPLLLIAAMVLDFLAIHPVADGNGRLARLLTLHQLLACGYGVARYISVEQLIFESKNSYYANLYESQRRWHDGEHLIWPWATYFARILEDAYRAFEARVGAGSPQGNKQHRVREYVLSQGPQEFKRRDIERAHPDISDATVRLVLNELRLEKLIEAEGPGRGARWRLLHSSASEG